MLKAVKQDLDSGSHLSVALKLIFGVIFGSTATPPTRLIRYPPTHSHIAHLSQIKYGGVLAGETILNGLAFGVCVCACEKIPELIHI